MQERCLIFNISEISQNLGPFLIFQDTLQGKASLTTKTRFAFISLQQLLLSNQKVEFVQPVSHPEPFHPYMSTSTHITTCKYDNCLKTRKLFVLFPQRFYLRTYNLITAGVEMFQDMKCWIIKNNLQCQPGSLQHFVRHET